MTINSMKLDSNFDLVIQNNSFVLLNGRDAIAQHMRVRYSLFLGEWRYDTSVGVPYYQDVLIKNPQFVVVQEVLKKTALDTPGITDLYSFNFDLNNSREAFLNLSAQSTDGIIDFNQTVEI